MTASKVRRVDFFPDEWIAGTRNLTVEERGAYWDICALIYSRGEPIADDAKWLCSVLGIHGNTWRTLRQRLIDKGKLVEVDHNGVASLANRRAERELDKAGQRIRLRQKSDANQQRIRRESGVDSSAKRARNADENEPVSRPDKGLAHPPTTNHQPRTSNQQPKDSEGVLPAAASGVERPGSFPAAVKDADEAHRLWLPVATSLGISDPGVMNSDRRAQVMARLAEVGLPGWRRFLDQLPRQRWLLANFRILNLKTLTKPETFLGVMEDRYVERHPAKDGTSAAFAEGAYAADVGGPILPRR